MAIFTGRATGAFGGTIRFDWYPDPDIVSMELIETADSLEDRSGPLALSRQVAIAEHISHFEEQHGPDGEAWRPWAASYAPIAAATNVGAILQRTMDLQGAMSAPGAYPITKDSVFFSTAGLPNYWNWMQEGTGSFSDWGRIDAHKAEVKSRGMQFISGFAFGIGKGRAIPARPYIGMSVEAQMKILEIFDLWFDNVTTSTFRRGTKTVLAARGPGGRFTGTQIVI